MIKYILKRIVQVIPVLLGVSIIVFLMLSLSPGDPARLALGMNAKPEQIEVEQHIQQERMEQRKERQMNQRRRQQQRRQTR